MTFEYGGDEQIKSIGGYLKRVRIEKELSLEEIASEIKIHEKYLLAIEEDNDSALPGKVYKELFIKSYADFLGVSVEEVLLRLPDAVIPPTEAVKPSSKPATAGTEEPVKAPAAVVTLARETPRNGKGRAWLLAALIVIIVGLAVVLYRLLREEHPEVVVPTPSVVTKTEETKPEPQREVAKVDSSESKDSSQSQDSLAAQDSGAVTDSAKVVVPPDSMRMLIIGKGDCWLGYQIDADTACSRMIQANDTVWLSMQDSMFVKTGRSDNVEVWFNAMPVKLPVAPGNTVSTIALDRENYTRYIDSARLVP